MSNNGAELDLRVITGEVVDVNTTKPGTTEAVAYFLWLLLQHEMKAKSSPHSEIYIEPKLLNARSVAEHKAQFLFKLNGGEGTAAGTDAAFHVLVNGTWEPWWNKERDTELLTQEEIVKEYGKLREVFVEPESEDGKIHAAWHISTSFVNGVSRSYDEWIRVVANPIQPELFDQIFAEAVDSNLIMTANPRMALMETLVEADLIESIGVIPGDVVRKGEDIQPYMREPQELFLELLITDVLTKVPHAMWHHGEN